MTFGIIGDILGKIRGVFETPNYDQNSYWTANHCPITETGRFHPHLIHSTSFRNQEIMAMCNTIVDLLIIIASHQNLSFEKLLAEQEENAAYFEAMTDGLSRCEKVLKKRSSHREDFSQTDILPDLIKKIKGLESKIEDQGDRIGELSSVITGIKPKEITEAIRESSSLQMVHMAKEIKGFKKAMEQLFEEIRTDPNNPKPTEIRTEKNSEDILRLNQELLPLVQEVRDTLTQTNKALEKVSNWVNS